MKFAGKSGGSDGAGFMTEGGGENHEVVFERAGELGEEMLFEGFKKEFASAGDAAADDDGFGVEKPAAVHRGSGQFPTYIFPLGERDGIAPVGGSGERGGGAFFKRLSNTGCGVGISSSGGDFTITHIFFEGT